MEKRRVNVFLKCIAVTDNVVKKRVSDELFTIRCKRNKSIAGQCTP